ncbi:helix-turn-helix transcriptional regulator [Streptomyces ossamyceticus]|nr:helix-turn-helix transcriptional regulator [Streptomyces ossamyceticus]
MALICDALGIVDSLSKREHEVLRVLSGGASDREIAERIDITVRTAKWHVANLRVKLGGLSRLQVCLVATLAHLRHVPCEQAVRRVQVASGGLDAPCSDYPSLTTLPAGCGL